MKIIQHDPQESIYKLASIIAKSFDKLEKDFPNWEKDDIRMTVYGRCANIVESVLFAMIFKKEQLVDKNWYNKISYIVPPNESQISEITGSFNLLLRVMLVTMFFHQLRHFLEF